MAKIKNGALIWARQTIKSDIFYQKPAVWFKIWFYLVSKVNYVDNKLFKRGTNFFTYEQIQLATKAKRSQVDGFIRWAKKESMLTTEKTTRGMIVTVLNYCKFQESVRRAPCLHGICHPDGRQRG